MICHRRPRTWAVVGARLLLAAWLLSPLAANAQDGPLSDFDIATAIDTQFLLDRTVNANRIDVQVTDGVVELTGSAGNLLAKERAARIAERVRGVRSVSNRIQVVPSVVLTDAAIRQSVSNALVDDPATEAYEVDVSVEGNVVTLTGTVDSLAEKELAGKVAKRVRSVVDVANRLDVELADTRPDGEIRDEVAQRLRWDVLVDDALVRVEVSRGRVILSGTVGSLAEKRQAQRDAWIHGVNAVDAEGLEIDPLLARRDLRGAKYAMRSHEEIIAAIKDALRLDPQVSSANIEPEVYAGSWVTLRGSVGNLRAKRVAERIARHTVGVVDVTNLLKVRPAFRPTDLEIEGRVNSRLTRNPLTSAYAIDISVNEGVVMLSGMVGSYAERNEAEREASAVPGVTEVVNELTIAGVDRLPPPYYGYPEASPPDRSGSMGRTDLQIEGAIRNELRWSPFIEAERIEVDVVDGAAVLEGTVDTWRDYYAAEDNAREGGATTVRNRLRVE